MPLSYSFAEQSPFGAVKTEASASPDLLPPFHHFQFRFHPSSSHASLPPSRLPSPHNNNTIYRFGSTSYPMTSSWPPSPSSGSSSRDQQQRITKYDPEPTMAYTEDYDDVTELVEINEQHDPTPAASRGVRRRSSKACDQCRKSKCKCERSALGEPCKSCVLLGTACTFLGPSRKRGPPKGYIDAIEARLHQTEALLGIIIASTDPRAQTLLRDLSKDTLAKEIINRVDNSPYGVKGRNKDGGDNKPRTQTYSASSSGDENGKVDLTSTHPSNEWQDRVSAMLRSTATATATTFPPLSEPRLRTQSSAPSLRLDTAMAISTSTSTDGRRTRRRVGTEDHRRALSASSSYSYHHPHYAVEGYRGSDRSRDRGRLLNAGEVEGEEEGDTTESEDGEGLAGAVGQLSLNEDEQVRYHGKASGLYLLGDKVDGAGGGRNEGGMWRFPKARVWPPLPMPPPNREDRGDKFIELPEISEQKHLLKLYFKHVHPALPVIHKEAFFESFHSTINDSPIASPESGPSTTAGSSPFNRRSRPIPPLLLFAMFALAARYSSIPKPPPASPSPPTMWDAGDNYLLQARDCLSHALFASSHPSTVQALLLLGYRELGIGAMAQAWGYVGMAIRMAQDLGMHRRAEGWVRREMGGRVFGEREMAERRRVWAGCRVVDVFVSCYIGRPLMVWGGDWDARLPGEDEMEEMEGWEQESVVEGEEHPGPVPGRVISCFNASATLSGIIAMIVQSIYAVRARPSEAQHIEGLLDKWYLELPEHLRYDVGVGIVGRKVTPPPHVLTLHMQYWCAVLLLHRPFIRNALYRNGKMSEEKESESEEMRVDAEKSYELCAGAANHITSIATVYSEVYTLDRCANFLCYYVFTASIMHVTSLTAHPDDPQARMGLTRCMDVLHLMEVLWPSAGRALELLRASKVNTVDGDGGNTTLLLLPLTSNTNTASSFSDRRKRSAEHPLDDNDNSYERSTTTTTAMDSSNNTAGQGIEQDFLELRAPYTSQYTAQAYSSTGHELYAPPSPPQQHVPPSLTSPYDRWSAAADPTALVSAGANAFGFPGTLSTSVLPQLYSTGLVDDHHHLRHHQHQQHQQHPHQHQRQQHQHQYPSQNQHQPQHIANNRSHAYHMDHGRTTASNLGHSVGTTNNRYPQYWNDFSTFPQLGTTSVAAASAYGGFHESASVPSQQQQHQHQQQQHATIAIPSSSSSHMYLAEPYSLYS